MRLNACRAWRPRGNSYVDFLPHAHYTQAVSNGPPSGRPPGKFTQVGRLERLRMLMLQRGGGATLSEISTVLDVSERSARRYLERFRAEFEIEKVPTSTRGSHWRVKASDQPRKIGLRRAQCFALLATRRLFEPMRGSALHFEIEMAISTLTALANRPGRGPNAGPVDSGVEDRFVHLPAEVPDYTERIEDIDAFYQAVTEQHPVDCLYRMRGMGQGRQDSTLLHPYGLVLYRDSIYIIAAEPGRSDREATVFALDELCDVVVRLEERFEVPAGFSLRDYDQGRFGLSRSGGLTRIVVDFDAAVAGEIRHRQYHRSQKLSDLRSGGVRMTFCVDDVGEVARWVLGFGSHARVIEPNEVRNLVIEELQSAVQLYR